MLPAIRLEGNRYIKVIDRARDRVVTVLELLSPSNKARGPDRDAYLMKRNEYLAAGLNVIELDLLRSGQRLPWGDKPPREADYYATVCRKWEFPRAGVWPIFLRDPLPQIPIPLEPEIEEPILALQRCFDEAYRKGRFRNEIDYGQAAAPALREQDAVWARQRVEEWKRLNS